MLIILEGCDLVKVTVLCSLTILILIEIQLPLMRLFLLLLNGLCAALPDLKVVQPGREVALWSCQLLVPFLVVARVLARQLTRWLLGVEDDQLGCGFFRVCAVVAPEACIATPYCSWVRVASVFFIVESGLLIQVQRVL